jgi:putative transposase
MARIARIVLPGIAHHVTQRGVRSMEIFHDDGDREDYLELLREQGQRFGNT